MQDDRDSDGGGDDIATPPTPPIKKPSAASKTVSRVLRSKWTWIAIGLILAIGVGITVALVWFQQINKKAGDTGGVKASEEVDKVNAQKKTACIVSTLCGAAVLGITLIVTKLTLKWT